MSTPGKYSVTAKFTIEPRTPDAVVASAAAAARAEHEAGTVFPVAVAYRYGTSLPTTLHPGSVTRLLDAARQTEALKRPVGQPESHLDACKLQSRLNTAGAFLATSGCDPLALEMAKHLVSRPELHALELSEVGYLLEGMRAGKRVAEGALKEEKAKSKRQCQRVDDAEKRIAAATAALSGTSASKLAPAWTAFSPQVHGPSGFEVFGVPTTGSRPVALQFHDASAAAMPARTAAAFAELGASLRRNSRAQHAAAPETVLPGRRVVDVAAGSPYMIFAAIEAVRGDASEADTVAAAQRAENSAKEAVNVWLAEAEAAQARGECTVKGVTRPTADPTATVVFGAADKTLPTGSVTSAAEA